MRTLAVNEKRARDFELILSIDHEVWKQVLSYIADNNSCIFTIDELSEFFSKHLTVEQSKILATMAISLRRLADEERESVKNVLLMFKDALSRIGWDADKLQNFDTNIGFWAEILESDSIKIAAKASDLYYRHTWHLHDFRVITDIRPVFNVKRTEIVGLISKNSIIITYSDAQEAEKTLEIAIGDDALRKIAEQVNIALEKSRKIDSSIASPLKLPLRHYNSDQN